MIPLSTEYAIREGQQWKDGKHSHVLLATHYHCPDLPTHSELCRHLWGCVVVNVETYKGWKIYYYPVGSQHWRAKQYGVAMCANSVEGLKRMIDIRVREARGQQGVKW